MNGQGSSVILNPLFLGFKHLVGYNSRLVGSHEDSCYVDLILTHLF